MRPCITWLLACGEQGVGSQALFRFLSSEPDPDPSARAPDGVEDGDGIGVDRVVFGVEEDKGVGAAHGRRATARAIFFMTSFRRR